MPRRSSKKRHNKSTKHNKHNKHNRHNKKQTTSYEKLLSHVHKFNELDDTKLSEYLTDLKLDFFKFYAFVKLIERSHIKPQEINGIISKLRPNKHKLLNIYLLSQEGGNINDNALGKPLFIMNNNAITLEMINKLVILWIIRYINKN